MTLKLKSALTSGFLAVTLAAWASATTLVRMSLAQLSQAATTVVRGTVTSQVSRWNAGHTRIYTLTTIAVRESFKGHPGPTVVIQQPGGTVGHIRVFVPGTILFRPEAQYVVFLERGPQGRYLPVGMAQGAYRLYSDRAGNERVALPLGSLALGQKSRMMGPSPTFGEFHAAVTGVLSAPIIIPRGTAIPLVIDRTAFHGVGQFGVEGHTTMDLFPGPGVVIPAGSRVEGLAQEVGGEWKIFWDSVSIRGESVRMDAAGQLPAGVSLRGGSMVARVR